MSEAAREASARVIIEEYGNLIERVAHALVKDYHLAEDVRQDVLMKVFSMDDDILDRPSPVIRRYLYVMAKNRALDLVKERTHHEDALVRLQDGHEESSLSMDKVAFVDERGFSMETQLVLKQLDQIDRDIICLRYGDGFSYREIAKIIGRKEDFVYQRVKRARDKLRSILLDGGFDNE